MEGHRPEEVADAARRMIESQGEEPGPTITAQTALQLREALGAVKAAEDVLLACDSIERIPRAAKQYVEAHERANAAYDAAQREAGVPEVPVALREGITTSG